MKKNDFYRGVKNVHYIDHGEWADPEISYKRHLFNYWEIEDSLWDMYKKECEENGVVVVDDFCKDGYIATERDFDKFCQRECKYLLNQIIYEERCY